VTKKDNVDHVLDINEIMEVFAKKSLLKWATQKKNRKFFLQSKHGKFVLQFFRCL
jgi:hypothetical protein